MRIYEKNSCIQLVAQGVPISSGWGGIGRSCAISIFNIELYTQYYASDLVG